MRGGGQSGFCRFKVLNPPGQGLAHSQDHRVDQRAATFSPQSPLSLPLMLPQRLRALCPGGIFFPKNTILFEGANWCHRRSLLSASFLFAFPASDICFQANDEHFSSFSFSPLLMLKQDCTVISILRWTLHLAQVA